LYAGSPSRTHFDNEGKRLLEELDIALGVVALNCCVVCVYAGQIESGSQVEATDPSTAINNI